MDNRHKNSDHLKRDQEVGKVLLSIDPGRDKCGIAFVDMAKNVRYKSIVPTRELEDFLRESINRFPPDYVIMGDGTWSRRLKNRVKTVIGNRPFSLVDEKHSTEKARLRYFMENPPRGLWKLLPITLQVPGEAYDDFAAIILAEAFIDGLSGADEDMTAPLDCNERNNPNRRHGRNPDGKYNGS